MTPDVEQLLAGLPRHDSDVTRSARVRARCHDALTRATTPALRPAAMAHRSSRLVESVLVGAFCVIYLCSLALNVIRVEGLF